MPLSREAFGPIRPCSLLFALFSGHVSQLGAAASARVADFAVFATGQALGADLAAGAVTLVKRRRHVV